jgi:hypothetical protein
VVDGWPVLGGLDRMDNAVFLDHHVWFVALGCRPPLSSRRSRDHAGRAPVRTARTNRRRSDNVRPAF